MSDRARALSILQQAREILIERITQRVLESQEDILEDAHGHAYLGEIEGLCDSLGSRLANVNLLLANVPPEQDAPPAAAESPPEKEVENLVAAASPPTGAGVEEESLQRSGPIAAEEPLPRQVTFADFARQITSGDVASAAHSLSVLFEVDLPRAHRCALRFREKLAQSPETMAQAMQLRTELQKGSVNSALMLLWECFGLQGPESIGVLQTLRAQL